MANLTTDNKSDPDFSCSAVPQNARMSRLSLTMAWWAICSAMIWLVISATLAINYGSMNTIVGLILSIITYGLINGVISRFAIKTGLSVGLFSRLIYGKVGDILATGIFFSIAIYYCVFEGSVIAVAIQGYFSSLELWQAYLIVVLYSVPLVFGSVGLWLDKLNGVLLPFYIIGLIAAVSFAVHQYGYSNEWLSMGDKGSEIDGRWWSCYSYFMGLWVMMMYTWDYARFGKKEDASYHSSINFGIPFYFFTYFINGLVGIFLVATIPSKAELSETSIVFALLKLMGFWGLLFIWVSQTRINTANFQLATVNMQSFLNRITQKVWSKISVAIVVGFCVFSLMLTDVFSFIFEALTYQSIFVVSWVVIALTHIVFSDDAHKADLEYDRDDLPRYKFGGLAAWVISSACGVSVIMFDSFLSSFSSVITILVAFLIYYFSLKNKVSNTVSGKDEMLGAE